MSFKASSAVASPEATGNSLKEVTNAPGQYFTFEKLRRTKSVPKRSQDEMPKISVSVPQEPTQPKNDYFNRFNRAKSRFFHSCRILKSDKNDKAPRSPLSSSSSKENPYQNRRSRPSLISETETLASSISLEDDDEEEGEEKKSLSEYISTPAPPPRTHLYRSNTTMTRRSYEDKSEPSCCLKPPSDDIASLAASVYSEDGSFLSYFDGEENNGCQDVRIYPVIQNGVKISDTHYWVINPPKSRSKQWQETKVIIRQGKDFNANGRPTSFSAKLLEEGHSHYENVPDTPPCSSPDSVSFNDDLGTTRLRRGRSECTKEVLLLVQRTLVEKLQTLVPTASLDECRAVLIGSSWNFHMAQSRLKVELLCRMGGMSKSMCERLLEHLDWDFDEACEIVRNWRDGLRQLSPFHLTRSLLTPSPSSAGNSATTTPDASPGIAYFNSPNTPLP